MDTPSGTGDPAALLDQIKAELRTSGANYADEARLLKVAEAALKLADDWDAEMARIEPSGADAVQPAKPGNYLVSGRTGALEDCAEELREAIRTALTGEAGDDGQ